MTWRVLISAPYFLPVLAEFRSRLEAEGIEIITAPVHERLSEQELLPLVAAVDGTICGDDEFTAAVLNAAPQLKIISKWGTGIDSIDSEAAIKLGIRVCNTPDAFTDPVADSVLGYILCFARGLPWMDQDVRRGVWTKRAAVSLRNCTLGVIGAGNIGRAVIRRARAFGMTVLGTEPVPVPEIFVAEHELRMVPLHTLLQQSDFVSLHCDLNPSSYHLLGRPELALLKSSAYLINTARGSIIDEPALVESLRTQKIAGAALDVFEVEPLPAGSPLRALPNCLLAPHNANSDPAAWRAVHEATLENLILGLRELK